MIRKVLFAALLLTAGPAWAAPKIDQAGADALKPRIVQSLSAIGASFAQSNITFKQTGNLLVEPAGEYYAITTPSISLEMPGGITRTVGMVAINAIPTDNPEVFKVAVALPTPMIDTSAGKNVGALSIGSQSMSGMWNLAAFTFLQMDADYKDIRDADSVTNVSSAIPEMTIKMKLDPKDNLYSGPFEALITNMNHKDSKGEWSAGSIRLRAMLSGVDIALAQKLPTTATSASPAGIQATFVTFASKLLDRADILIDEHDLTYKTQANAGTVKSMTWNGTLSKIKTGLADGTVEMTGDGFTLADPAAARFAPTHSAFKASFEKLPLVALVGAPDNAAIKAAFDKAGTHTVIDTSTIDAPGFGMLMNGDLTANAASPFGVGKLHLEMRGIDDLTAYLSTPTGAASLGLGSASNNLVPLLAVVQLTGRVTKDTQGRDVRSYDLSATQDGHILLNGNDMTSVTAGLTAAAAGMKAQGPGGPVIIQPAKPVTKH